jgi:O-antigen/teichoic acid export membrane protein
MIERSWSRSPQPSAAQPRGLRRCVAAVVRDGGLRGARVRVHDPRGAHAQPTDYGLIGVLWAATFLLVVVALRPLEQTTSRAVADRLARGGSSVRGIVRSVIVIYALAVAGLAALAAVSWSAITDRLFEGNAALTLALVVGVAGYGIAYVLRGLVQRLRLVRRLRDHPPRRRRIRLLAALPLVAVAAVDTAAAAVALAGSAAP